MIKEIICNNRNLTIASMLLFFIFLYALVCYNIIHDMQI